MQNQTAQQRFGTPVFSAQPADPLIGQTVGRYRVVRRLGRGGMGTVYLAEHQEIQSKVALKLLHARLSSDPVLLKRFHAEARAMNLIRHENIVDIYDMGFASDGRCYLMMEYLDGQPLSELLRGPIAPKLAFPILGQICDALGAAHARGVLHRDLRPENIFLLRRTGQEHFIKLLDFGVAKLEVPGEDDSTDRRAGRAEFMAPEQLAGKELDGRADLYSLGVIAYLLATGQLPFLGPRLRAATPAERVNPAVPRAWSAAISRALEEDPKARFATAAELRSAFEHALLEPAEPSAAAAEAVAPGSVPLVIPLADRHAASLLTTVRAGDGRELLRGRCVELSLEGMFLSTDALPPPPRARVRLQVDLCGAKLELQAEVVHHVWAAEAQAWSMACGFAVQFVNLDQVTTAALTQVIKQLPAIDLTAPLVGDDPVATRVLELMSRNLAAESTPYEVLGVAEDTDFRALCKAAADAHLALSGLRERPLSPVQQTLVARGLDRIDRALHLLGTPSRRAEHDAEIGNFRGVARCLAAGLTLQEVQTLRNAHQRAHLARSPGSSVALASGWALEASGDVHNALATYEHALIADPLNISLQRAYWTLLNGSRHPAGAAAGL